jgi:hypothetical protein
MANVKMESDTEQKISTTKQRHRQTYIHVVDGRSSRRETKVNGGYAWFSFPIHPRTAPLRPPKVEARRMLRPGCILIDQKFPDRIWD